MSDSLTYSQAGVNIAEADAAKREMAAALDTRDPRVLNRHGAFASLFEANFPGIKSPVLVLKTEEPGSKQLLAFQYNRIAGICQDLINHLINDIVVMGAQPLAVLDTIICSKLEKPVVVQIVAALAEACRAHGCSLVGGETSEQPGVLNDGRYVLCASVVGVVDKEKIIDGSKIAQGDAVLALASNGVHTNGYTLVRRLISQNQRIVDSKVGNETFLDAILRPHRSYLEFLKPIFSEFSIHGLAHITGGGIEGNLNRILPGGVSALINRGKIEIPEVFKAIRAAANSPDEDMLKTFNMGAGMVMVVAQSDSVRVATRLSELGCESYQIGEIVRGDQTVRFEGKLRW